MALAIVQHDVQAFFERITPADVREQLDELDPRLMTTKNPEEFIPPNIIRPQQVACLVRTRIAGGQAAHFFLWGPVHPMMGANLQGSELVYADDAPVPRFRLPIAALDRFFLAA